MNESQLPRLQPPREFSRPSFIKVSSRLLTEALFMGGHQWNS